MSDPLSRWQTWREIMAQPAIWSNWAGNPVLAAAHDWVRGTGTDEVWLTGAGSSAYIGDMVVAGLEGQDGPRLRAVPTTDLVSRPDAYLKAGPAGRRPLVVSFGRSGNSAESLGTLDALDALAPDAPRLNITCNGDSALAKRAGANGHVLILPEATHDQGFAMTSSLTTMVLSALALFDAAPGWPDRLARAGETATTLLPRLAGAAATARLPERIVFVGAGPLAYAARESALKVMELTAGRVPALWDSSLGFRHGPKSFVLGETDIVILTSPEAHAALYDADLVAELRAQFPASRVTALGPGGDLDIAMPDGAAWGAPLAILYAQCLAVAFSDRLGLAVDDPFAGRGTLSRVVSGVRLHPVAQ